MNSWQFGGVILYQGNCLDVLPTLPAESVQACITSPPYWGLRDYGTARWEGGDPGCDHLKKGVPTWGPGSTGSSTLQGKPNNDNHERESFTGDICRKCGAIRIDQQLGLERVPDCLGWATKQPCGECYVCHTVAWAREVRRVLRDDGVMFLVLGDSYAQGGGKQVVQTKNASHGLDGMRQETPGFAAKQLIGIPWRVALALQADGWWLRSDVIWSKPNPMPESVTDRPTKAHEYVFILAKSARYYWDADAVREPHKPESIERMKSPLGAFRDRFDQADPKLGNFNDYLDRKAGWGNGNGRNLRTVWSIATQPYAGAHFAVFPEKLVEPMVKAATSERGCCPKCGKAWDRMTEKEVFPPPDRVNNNPFKHDAMTTNGEGATTLRNIVVNNTAGWQPACACDAGDPVPCTILDPFGGSGTVASVATRLGRRAILCELNPDYIELQKERVGQTQPALIGI